MDYKRMFDIQCLQRSNETRIWGFKSPQVAFLSNMALVSVNGYRSVEHAYQAEKTVILEEKNLIKACQSPYEAKRIAKGLTLRPDWTVKYRLEAMERFVSEKFSDPVFASKLLATGDKELVEGNWWHDNFWGECCCDRCIEKLLNAMNHLGRILMRVRKCLTKGS